MYQIHWIYTYAARHEGWMVTSEDDEPLFRVSVKNKKYLYAPPFKVVIEGSIVRQLEKKEKEVGILLE